MEVYPKSSSQSIVRHASWYTVIGVDESKEWVRDSVSDHMIRRNCAQCWTILHAHIIMTALGETKSWIGLNLEWQC